MTSEPRRPAHFIQELIERDNAARKWGTWPGSEVPRVQTRFPPEPNGYLHIGHAKSICLNFGLAEAYRGKCNLRFDDTNPTREEQEYVDSIIADVRWLGFDWSDRLFFASDYFERLYEYAVELVQAGKAYVCDLPLEEVRRMRGTLTRPGAESPHRDRPVEENLDLLERMRKGEFPDGSRTLRAKIDMSHANMNMRDPIIYRILHAAHHRTGDRWCIYPMYDWAHGLEDSIEGITHSICTLEFEDHRPLYDWFIDAINEGRGPDSPFGEKIHHPQQIEFARLELNYTVMSKRRLLELVKERRVRGWDDPRMPTLSGMRRRGYPPEAIRAFCETIGVAKMNSTVDMALLEHHVRDELNKTAPRVMGVLRPLKVVITNYPEEKSEQLEAVNNPEDPAAGTRSVPFSRVLYIEQDDFRENPPKKYFRLAPGREVRLRYAYFITCQEVVKSPETGKITELRCTYDPATRGGDAPDGRKVKATLHWLSAAHALPAEVRLYDRLFSKADPDEVEETQATEPRRHKATESQRHEATQGGPGGVSARGHRTGAAQSPDHQITGSPDWKSNLNPDSLEIIERAYVEPSLRAARPGDRVQFERLGYFCVDPDTTADRLVFNRTVTLKDAWARIAARGDLVGGGAKASGHLRNIKDGGRGRPSGGTG